MSNLTVGSQNTLGTEIDKGNIAWTGQPNIFLFVYRDEANSGYPTAVAGRVDDVDTITFGSPLILNSSTSYPWPNSVVKTETIGRMLCSFITIDLGAVSQAVVIDVDETTLGLTKYTNTVVSSDPYEGSTIAKIDGYDKYIFFRFNGNSYLQQIIVELTGTTISVAATQGYNMGSPDRAPWSDLSHIFYDTNKYILYMRNKNQSSFFYFVKGEVDPVANTISGNSTYTLSTLGEVEYPSESVWVEYGAIGFDDTQTTFPKRLVFSLVGGQGGGLVGSGPNSYVPALIDASGNVTWDIADRFDYTYTRYSGEYEKVDICPWISSQFFTTQWEEGAGAKGLEIDGTGQLTEAYSYTLTTTNPYPKHVKFAKLSPQISVVVFTTNVSSNYPAEFFVLQAAGTLYSLDITETEIVSDYVLIPEVENLIIQETEVSDALLNLIRLELLDVQEALAETILVQTDSQGTDNLDIIEYEQATSEITLPVLDTLTIQEIEVASLDANFLQITIYTGKQVSEYSSVKVSSSGSSNIKTDIYDKSYIE